MRPLTASCGSGAFFQLTGKSVNDRYTHPLEQAHLAAAEQTAALVHKARNAA
jgi:hypothetical protein